MTPWLFALTALAGGVGAGLRFAVDALITRVIGDRLPWGIFLVNVTGSLALGVLASMAPSLEWSWVLGVGLLGGYTTFSAVAVSTVLLAEERRSWAAMGYASLTLVISVAAAGLGACQVVCVSGFGRGG